MSLFLFLHSRTTVNQETYFFKFVEEDCTFKDSVSDEELYLFKFVCLFLTLCILYLRYLNHTLFWFQHTIFIIQVLVFFDRN